MLADRGYPDWILEQCLKLARNQFVRGIRSSSVQLILMKETPATLDGALQLAQTQEAVETAQKRLQGTGHAAAATTPAANTLQQPARRPVTDLSQQVQQLTDAVARLSTRVYGDNAAGNRPPRRRRGPPVCWGCGETGHIRRNCPKNQPSQPEGAKPKSTSSLATDTALSVDGKIEQRPTRMLVDTGSAVTIVREDAWLDVVSRARRSGGGNVWSLTPGFRGTMECNQCHVTL